MTPFPPVRAKDVILALKQLVAAIESQPYTNLTLALNHARWVLGCVDSHPLLNESNESNEALLDTHAKALSKMQLAVSCRPFSPAREFHMNEAYKILRGDEA